MDSKLIFLKQPSSWEEYLPLGNGRLGCMVKASPCNEIIQLNEESIWSGGPQNRLNPDTKKYIQKIRTLVNDGKVLEAQDLAFKSMSGTFFNQRAYQTAGDFHIDFFSKKNSGLEHGWPLQHKADKNAEKTYRAELDLETACTLVTYKDDDGVLFERRTWVSAVDDVIFMHVKASSKQKINFSAYLDRGMWVDSIKADDGFIFLEDSHGIPFCAGAGVVTEGGESFTNGTVLTGNECSQALFFIDIQAMRWNKKWNKNPPGKKDYENYIKHIDVYKECRKKLEGIKKQILLQGIKTFVNNAFKNHTKEYSSYWNKMELRIGTQKPERTSKKETATPVLLGSAAFSNTSLVNLYAAFCRYLLISGSRKPGVLPLTLQGLWNSYIEPPWQSKYTININAQMNYWPVNMANLSECELPLFNLMERAYPNGCAAAKKMYGCRGWVLHHNTDFWGDAAPQDAWIPSTYWVLGAAWLSTHIYEHYEYTMDKEFLQKYYYLMHEAALFFVDYLVPSKINAPDGKPYLIINPSLSPENSYVTKAGEVGAFCAGCQMDSAILEHCIKSCLNAKKILLQDAHNKYGKKYADKDFTDFEYILNHLKKPELNKDGSLMEWNTEVKEVEPGHRHVSHLYGLFPGHSISLDETPELCKASEKTLIKRLKNGGGHTGWSQAWIINFWASLGKGDNALSSIIKLFQNSTLPNLLDNHPPFQIDGNFGTLAGIIRLLVQSKMNVDGTVCVKLLPSLPAEKAWQSGRIKGVAIKGGWTIDFEWNNGKVISYELHPGQNAVEKMRVKVLENN